MDKMIACCGIPCHECPTLLATQNDDDDARAKTAALWKKQFGMDLTVQDMNCDGCLSDTGRLFGHCYNCEIKKCCQEKELDNCAGCEDYACEKLEAFFSFVPYAKPGLEEIRSHSMT